MESVLVNNRSCKIYFLVDNERVYFNADFDSGNVQKVQQVSPYIFKVYPGLDKTRNCSEKTFFHFKVYGLKMCTANFIVTRVNILQKLIKTNDKDQNSPPYFPVYRTANEPYKKIKRQVKKYYNCFDEPQLSFSFQFDQQPFVQFAFTYPYPYQQCQDLISTLQNKLLDNPSIYFHHEVLCLSKEKRNIRLITITDKQNCENEIQDSIEGLFPFDHKRPLKSKKPVIFMSARVHPGQSPSSFAIEGALRFLLDEKDCRSYLLRKNFLIKIIPMLNPDGVFHGMFRTDTNGQNLNRVYTECNQKKQQNFNQLSPTIWGIQKYALWLKENKNVLFYFDFHAHPSTKNFFIYGNSFNEISLQTEAQFFGKMIEFNCPYFENFESIYSEKQMKIKHKNDSYSKQGCGRVYMHKLFNIIHSYTVECGYFGWTKLNQIEDKERDSHLGTGYLVEGKQFQKILQKSYDPECYMMMGKSILITILDLFGLNPFPKKIKGQISTHSDVRKYCGTKIYHEVQTFRIIDANSYKKLSELSTLIEETYYNSKLKGTNLKLSTNETNTQLKDQLAYLNASPKTRQFIKNSKKKKITSLPKYKDYKKYPKKQLCYSMSKLQPLKIKDQLVFKNPLFSYLQNKALVQQNQIIDQAQQYLTSKVKNLKFLYNDLERFNEKQTQPSSPRAYPGSERKIPNNSITYSKSSIFHNSTAETPDLHHTISSRNKTYNSALKVKQFIPEARESKIKSTLQKSITLRKGSVSKVIMINKDDLKFLRISNLVQKKLYREAVNRPAKQHNWKDTQDEKERTNLPSINGKKKF